MPFCRELKRAGFLLLFHQEIWLFFPLLGHLRVLSRAFLFVLKDSQRKRSQAGKLQICVRLLCSFLYVYLTTFFFLLLIILLLSLFFVLYKSFSYFFWCYCEREKGGLLHLALLTCSVPLSTSLTLVRLFSLSFFFVSLFFNAHLFFFNSLTNRCLFAFIFALFSIFFFIFGLFYGTFGSPRSETARDLLRSCSDSM